MSTTVQLTLNIIRMFSSFTKRFDTGTLCFCHFITIAFICFFFVFSNLFFGTIQLLHSRQHAGWFFSTSDFVSCMCSMGFILLF